MTFNNYFGFITKETGNKSQTVIHMKKDFLGNDFFNIPEMSKIQKLLEVTIHVTFFLNEHDCEFVKKTSILQICSIEYQPLYHPR